MSKIIKLIPKDSLLIKLKPYINGINSKKNYCKSCFSYYNIEELKLKNSNILIMTNYYNDESNYPIHNFKSSIKINTDYILNKCKIYSYNKPFNYTVEENIEIYDDNYDNDLDIRETNYKYRLNINKYTNIQYELTSQNGYLDIDIKKYYNNFIKEIMNHIDDELHQTTHKKIYN